MSRPFRSRVVLRTLESCVLDSRVLVDRSWVQSFARIQGVARIQGSLTQLRTPEISSIQSSMAQVGSGEISALEVSVLEVGPAEVLTN